MNLMQNNLALAGLLMVAMTICVVVAIRRLPQSRLKLRQKLERAAGGQMSEAVLQTYTTRAKARDVCSLVGTSIGTLAFAICLALEANPGLGLILFLAGAPLGLAVGSAIGAFRIIGPIGRTRTASLKPREIADYLPQSSITLQWLFLLMPILAIIVGATALAQGTRYQVAVIALIVSSVFALAAGVAAPALRRRLLEIPNRAENDEQRFWNNAWLSWAIGDITVAAALAALMLAGIPVMLGVLNLLDTYWFPIGAATAAFTGICAIAGLADAALSGTSTIPWYVRQNPPHRQRPSAAPQAGTA